MGLSCFGANKACSYLWAVVLVFPFFWNVLPPSSHMDGSGRKEGKRKEGRKGFLKTEATAVYFR